jgi:heat shock protein HslJ
MNKTFRIALVAVGVIVLGALIFGGGMMIGRANSGISGINPSTMMGWTAGGNNPGPAMMTNGYNIMGGYGMMGGYQSNNSVNVKPLTVDQAKQAVEGYLTGLNNPDLELKEIMIFDNNAYARITEKSTGIGAMELLVDPASLAVFPEYGPNMMWNLKYGLMNGTGGMTLAPAPRAGVGGYGMNQAPSSGAGRNGGGMMGGSNPMQGNGFSNPGSVSATMTVTPEQALKITQQYLDQQFPGYQAPADADPFYGYYTLDIMKDGTPTGMLSVNGFSGQVFLHTWHGTFIEMSE